MNNLSKKFISIFFMILIIGISFNISVSAQQATVVVTSAGREYDADNDGVCNWEKGNSKYNGNEQAAGRYCTITEYGDLCPGTEGRAGRFGREDSGCSADQLSRIRDYWSVSAGELKPKFLKVNWLTDSRNGIRAYQEINLGDNFRTAGEDVEIRDVSVSCSNDKGIVYQNANIVREDSGKFVNARIVPVAPENREQKSRIIELQVHRLGEGGGRGETRTEDIKQEKPGGIDEIRTTCTVRTYSCIKRADESENINCVDLYPPESDEIEIRIPIDTVVIKPEEFLKRGIELSQNILDLTEKLIPKVNKLYFFTLKWCGYSLAAVTATKFFGFLSGFADLAELIWYGPEELRSISLTLPSIKDDPTTKGIVERKGYPDKNRYNSFIISGRSMCAASTCPKNWCRLGSIQTGTELTKKNPITSEEAQKFEEAFNSKRGGTNYKPEFDFNNDGEINFDDQLLLAQDASLSPVTLLSGQKSIQDSLLLSIGCGCISGILVKLYQLRAIADSWNSCLKQAQAGEEFKGTCDKILSQGICTFVLGELTSLKGVNLMSLAYEKIINPLEEEIADAFGLKTAADESKDRVKDFAESEVKEIGEAYGLGVAGYAELPIARSICSLAVYGRLPSINVYSRFDIDKPIVKTSANINWDSAQILLGPDNQPFFEYSVEWMVVAGRDNLRYSIYLRGADGAKSERIDTGTGRLAKIGDYDSNYLQFVDPAQYVEACVEIPDEFLGPKCFGPGTGSGFGITGDFFGFSDVNDKDKDGLPDEWEARHNLRHNLKADNQDSDGDGVTDNKEDNDNDGINNYNEYKAGTDPNKAGVKEDGSYVESECVATFKNEIATDKVVYNPGETIKLNNLGIDVKDPPADIALKIEITETRGDFRKNVYFGISEIDGRNSIDVWTIPTGSEAPANGLYDVRLSLIKWKSSFSNVQCVNSEGKITNSAKEMQIHIGSVGTCINPDSGANEIYTRTACIPKGATGAGLKGSTDECSSGELVEYVCSSVGECEGSLVLKCSANEKCEEGICVAKEEEVVAPPAVTPSLIVDDFVIFNLAKFPTDDQTKKHVLETITNLNSYSPSLGIWNLIEIESRINLIDSDLVLALITTESKGAQFVNGRTHTSSANAVGIMQIVPSSYPELDSRKLGNDVRYNLVMGIRILASKEKLNDNTYKKTIAACIDPQRKAKYEKYLNSKPLDSALRLYNGGGCNCEGCDDDFVEKVNKYYEVWKATIKPFT